MESDSANFGMHAIAHGANTEEVHAGCLFCGIP